MLKETLARVAATIAAAGLPVVTLDVTGSNDHRPARRALQQRPRSRSGRDNDDVAKYRHFMITSSALEILAHNRALVKKRETEIGNRGSRLRYRRLAQLRRGT